MIKEIGARELLSDYYPQDAIQSSDNTSAAKVLGEGTLPGIQGKTRIAQIAGYLKADCYEITSEGEVRLVIRDKNLL